MTTTKKTTFAVRTNVLVLLLLCIIYLSGCHSAKSSMKMKPVEICEDPKVARRKCPPKHWTLHSQEASASRLQGKETDILTTISPSTLPPDVIASTSVPPNWIRSTLATEERPSNSATSSTPYFSKPGGSKVGAKILVSTVNTTATTGIVLSEVNLQRSPAASLPKSWDSNTSAHDNIENLLIRKEILHRPPNDSTEWEESKKEEYVCTFEDELHELATAPQCSPATWLSRRNPFNSHSRLRRNAVMGQRTPLTREEKARLQLLYGKHFDLPAAETLKGMGASVDMRRVGSPYSNPQKRVGRHRYSPIPHSRSRFGRQSTLKFQNTRSRPTFVRNKLQKIFEKRKGRQIRSYPQILGRTGREDGERRELIKLLLDELNRPEEAKEEKGGRGKDKEGDKDSEQEDRNECSLFGTWLSPVAGVAMELRAEATGIRVHLEDIPLSPNKLLSSSWVGSVMLSPLSPTTLTIIFQEGTPPGEPLKASPGTAVFTGQCVACEGGAAIQGTWVVFSRDRQCASQGDPFNSTRQ